MEPILKTVAREYAERYPDLKNVCFIFPNKRCGIFLRKYFAEFDVLTEDLPHILTISDLITQISHKQEAGKIEQLFTLYNCYLEILRSKERKREEEPVEFENFRGWGETVLADFNTVDMYLADPEEVFKNIKDYREISSNFLTEEQKEVMKEYFGIEEPEDAGNFWKKFKDPEKMTDLKSSFLNLWQVLAPLHKKFIATLEEEKKGTSGSLYRSAAERVSEKGKDAFPYKKIVAVGFNALTEAERVIFKTLRDEEGYEGYDELIDFIWDSYGPVLENPDFSASKFVNYNRTHFPMPEWFENIMDDSDSQAWPEINIVSAPSNSSQAKVAGEILQEYTEDEGREMIEEAEVALVLPDETLLSNVLFSIPDELEDVNLTMGFNLRQTSVAAFVYLLRRLYATMHEGNKVNSFYVRDLRLLFSHPYVHILLPSEKVGECLEYIDTFHKVSVSTEEIEEKIPESGFLFSFPSKKGNGDDIFPFVENILTNLLEKIGECEEDSNNQNLSDIKVYIDYLQELRASMQEYEVGMSPLGVLQLIDRIVAASKIGFEGEPLTGLQVMGTLETRALDFKHIILLSMNEGIMPRKAMTSTFIPETLRKAYGLPPAHYGEELFGYYFYRLISRAEKVTLIYDGRTGAGNKGGESRYLLQLREFAPADKLKETSWNYRLQNRIKRDASIAKTEEIRRMAEVYLTKGAGRKNLSASSLNNYRECQVKFFLRNVLNLDTDPDRTDFMDAITVGDILHEVMMELYLPDVSKQRILLSKPELITSARLKEIIDNPQKIRDLVDQQIQKHYYGGQKDTFQSASGVTELLAGQISELIESIVNYDLTLAPFLLYGCEIEKNLRIRLESGREINFRFAIDRLDEIEVNGEKHLRVVDYKTGSRKRKAKDLDDVFKGSYLSEQIFQLFIYVWVLGKIGMPGWEDAIAEIYFVPDLEKRERGLPEIGKKKVESVMPYIKDFILLLENMINDIFISDVYKETPDTGLCNNCEFNSFCSR